MLSRRSKRACNLPCLPGIERVAALKILGVTITGKLSQRTRATSSASVRSRYTSSLIRVLCCRGTNDQALQAVYRSVVIAKLLNAACAWWGFTTADDRNCIEAVVRWMGQRQRSWWRTLNTCCSAEFGTPPTTFYMNLPHPNTHHYELRPRRHNLSLTFHWDQRNFISRNPVLGRWPSAQWHI